MPHLSRRAFLRTTTLAASALVLSPLTVPAEEKKPAGFTLPKLPYAYDALEPSIDARTMEIHYTKHHKAYVDNLNKALAKYPDLLNQSLADLLRQITKVPETIRQAVINNGGGDLNHTLFWQMMAPAGKGGEPGGELLKAIESDLGGLDQFRKAFTQAGLTRFGSGWAWLTYSGGKLHVISTPNQNYPYLENQEPILGLDVWEHAYYLKYQNRRADYIKNWWNVVNWNDVAERFHQASKS